MGSVKKEMKRYMYKDTRKLKGNERTSRSHPCIQTKNKNNRINAQLMEAKNPIPVIDTESSSTYGGCWLIDLGFQRKKQPKNLTRFKFLCIRYCFSMIISIHLPPKKELSWISLCHEMVNPRFPMLFSHIFWKWPSFYLLNTLFSNYILVNYPCPTNLSY